jgi:iron(III) transport system permease protein
MTQTEMSQMPDAGARKASAARDGDRAWTIFAVFISALVATPVIAVGVLAISPTANIWPHLWATVLPGYVLIEKISRTGILVARTAGVVMVIVGIIKIVMAS